MSAFCLSHDGGSMVVDESLGPRFSCSVSADALDANTSQLWKKWL